MVFAILSIWNFISCFPVTPEKGYNRHKDEESKYCNVEWEVKSLFTFALHTVDTEFSVTNFFCLHFSEHAQWGLPVMSDILVKIFVDISCNICGSFLL